MNRQTLVPSILGLVLMAGAAVVIQQVGARQVLAPPGVKTHSVPGSIRLEAELPERVLDCDSKPMEITDTELAVLPQDTSFGKRRYRAADGLLFDLQVVLMGKDRTSMHKPQICLTGQGWHINDVASKETTVEMTRPFRYDLPVVELVASQRFKVNGEAQLWSGVYVYWFVADDAMSASTVGVATDVVDGLAFIAHGGSAALGLCQLFCPMPAGAGAGNIRANEEVYQRGCAGVSVIPPAAIDRGNSDPLRVVWSGIR